MLGRAFGHDAPTTLAAAGAQINDVVGRFDHMQVVLDHDQRIARIAQLMQYFEQLGNVVKVQAGGRLIQNIERASGTALGELARELDTLRLPA